VITQFLFNIVKIQFLNSKTFFFCSTILLNQVLVLNFLLYDQLLEWNVGLALVELLLFTSIVAHLHASSARLEFLTAYLPHIIINRRLHQFLVGDFLASLLALVFYLSLSLIYVFFFFPEQNDLTLSLIAAVYFSLFPINLVISFSTWLARGLDGPLGVISHAAAFTLLIPVIILVALLGNGEMSFSEYFMSIFLIFAAYFPLTSHLCNKIIAEIFQ